MVVYKAIKMLEGNFPFAPLGSKKIQRKKIHAFSKINKLWMYEIHLGIRHEDKTEACDIDMRENLTDFFWAQFLAISSQRIPFHFTFLDIFVDLNNQSNYWLYILCICVAFTISTVKFLYSILAILYRIKYSFLMAGNWIDLHQYEFVVLILTRKYAKFWHIQKYLIQGKKAS